MQQSNTDTAGARSQIIELIQYATTPANVGSNCSPGYPQHRERAETKDETGTKQNVDRVGQPERPHRYRCIASSTENSVDHKNQNGCGVAAEHNPRKIPAHADDLFVPSHAAQNVWSKRTSE